MKHEFELLAPAGSFEILKAVISAGADAVYVGGNQFGARAYANNFTEEELLEAIDYVHLRGKKLFLTVNTLFKNNEINEALYHYLLPYYKRGLDAVIVQDFGVISFIKKYFPDLPIHTSTQMTITGTEGAKLMKNLGVERVVLARELSLAEMKKIHNDTNIELEAFIHGALCYSYSGQCLFSSMLGGRSGNRGRCAQPCRLPYAVLDEKKKEYKKESYVLSLKDLCGIQYLKQLRDAGVYSLKIEGRMKQASYAAGVVSFYRKYIDLEKEVSKEDLQCLHDLGNRCGFTTEYFIKHNDNSMITFEKPSFEKSNEVFHQQILNKYVGQKHQIPVNGSLVLRKGQALEFYINCGEYYVYVSLGEVQGAKNKPLSIEDVRERMNKTGESDFYFETIEIQMDDDIFVPNGILNQLRRDALSQLKSQMLTQYMRNEILLVEKEKKDYVKKLSVDERSICSCETREQFETILNFGTWISDIYVDTSMYKRDKFIEQLDRDIQKTHKEGKAIFLKLPAIFRMHTSNYFKNIKSDIENSDLDGLVVRNYEELCFVKEFFPSKQIVIDHSLYTYNDYAKNAFVQYNILRDTIPLELNQKEIKNRDNINSEMVIYGYYPLMTTAGCVHKNTKACDKNSQITYLKDRFNVLFPVKNYCKDCYNIIYNSVPVYLFAEVNRLKESGVKNFRYDFTIESAAEVEMILNSSKEGKGEAVLFTNGHYKRGVE